MKTLHIILMTTLLLSSCATKKEIKPYRPSYSQETENEFQSIENDRKEVLERYRRLREKDWENYKRQGRRKVRHYQSPTKKAYRKATRKVVTSKPKPPLPEEIIKEMKIEMRQYQNYFCMEQRKSNRFSGKADCQAFTENILNQCEEKHPVIRDRKIIKCIQKGLR